MERITLPADVTAALERARLQVEALAQTADELQAVLPDAVGSALRDGLREEAAPLSRRLGEVEGLQNQAIRRLRRLAGGLAGGRPARVGGPAPLLDRAHGPRRAVSERAERVGA